MSRLEKKPMSSQRVLVAIVLLSVAIGGLTGLGLGFTARYQGPQTREFWLFNGSLPFNESKFGNIPHDVFVPDRMIVNRGDAVVIHYLNIEDTAESHTFTMGTVDYAPGPYKIDQLVPAGRNVTITFTANIPGVFRYVCTIHQPTMTGYITIIG